MAYSVKKTKAKISWGTTKELPNPDGLQISLNREIMLIIRESLVYVMDKKTKVMGELIGIINPYTLQFLVNPSVKDFSLVLLVNKRLEEILTLTHKTVKRNGGEFNVIPYLGLRQLLGTMYMCPKAETILLHNSLECFILNYPNRAYSFLGIKKLGIKPSDFKSDPIGSLKTATLSMDDLIILYRSEMLKKGMFEDFLNAYIGLETLESHNPKRIHLGE